MVGALWTLAGLVVAQPFHLQATLEAETRGGRLATGDENGLGAEFQLMPTGRLTYADAPVRLEGSYGARFFTRARDNVRAQVLVLHRATVRGALEVSPRLQLSLMVDGAMGQLDFSNAVVDLDAIDEAGTLPQQVIIEYDRGFAQTGVRWQPARLWAYESQLSGSVFRPEETPQVGRCSDDRDTPCMDDNDCAGVGVCELPLPLQSQDRVNWLNTLTRQTDRTTTWGGALEFDYRSYYYEPDIEITQHTTFTGATATGTVEKLLGRRTTVRGWLGAHGSSLRQTGEAPVGRAAREVQDGVRVLPVIGTAGEHTIAVSPNRRLEMDGRVELRPFHDRVFSTLDPRLIVTTGVRMVLSVDLQVMATARWTRLVHFSDDVIVGQTEQVFDATARFGYRLNRMMRFDTGLRYSARLRRTQVDTVVTTREEMVAFLIVTLSANLLGD